MRYSASEFCKRLTDLCEQRQLSPRKTLKEVFGMDGSNIQKWRNDESTPKADLYLAVAEYFDVTTDYLYGRELSADADTLSALTPDEKLLIARLRQVDDERARLVYGVMDVLLEKK